MAENKPFKQASGETITTMAATYKNVGPLATDMAGMPDSIEAEIFLDPDGPYSSPFTPSGHYSIKRLEKREVPADGGGPLTVTLFEVTPEDSHDDARYIAIVMDGIESPNIIQFMQAEQALQDEPGYQDAVLIPGSSGKR